MKRIALLLLLVFISFSCSKEENTDPCQEFRQTYQNRIDEAVLNGDLVEADGLRSRLNELLIDRGCFSII